MDTSNVRASLLRKHPAEAKGVWVIYGEDPNCDLGGHHSNPKLATVSGTYKNVVEYALTLTNFFTWGSGGEITKLEPPTNILDVDKLYDPEILKLKDEQVQLKKRLADIDAEIEKKTTTKR